jgi:hypothetical protein
VRLNTEIPLWRQPSLHCARVGTLEATSQRVLAVVRLWVLSPHRCVLLELRTGFDVASVIQADEVDGLEHGGCPAKSVAAVGMWLKGLEVENCDVRGQYVLPVAGSTLTYVTGRAW